MSYFAQVSGNIVINVMSAVQEEIDTGIFGDPNTWIQTSYNTHGGIHYAPNSNTPDGGIALRANYAGIGYIYDSENDVFYKPRPVDIYNVVCQSWTIGAPDWTWKPPVAKPNDEGTGQPPKTYTWDESTVSWKDITPVLAKVKNPTANKTANTANTVNTNELR
jgi:hypothetical protein